MIKTKIESGIDCLEASKLLPSKKMAMRVGVSSFPTSSYFTRKAEATSSTLTLGLRHGQCMQQMVGKPMTSRRIIACSAVQESSTSTVAAETKEEVKTAPEKSPEKPKRPAKAPAKALPQMMEEDVIPSLKSILEDEDDLSDIELSFQGNRLEGSFQKKGIPYSFWAFFPNGVLTGPKGFSLSSYGSGSSTVEPFLIDEKKITPKHVVFWVVKRLAAQGIIPVWKE